MRVSSKADYGVRALFDLAEHYRQGPTQSRDIALRQAIPEAYLHQVLGALNRAGFVRSTRGPLGGHELVRDPGEITLWDVLRVLDGVDARGHPHLNGTRNGEGPDIVHEVWHELQARSIEFLEGITFETLLRQRAAGAPTGNYSI